MEDTKFGGERGDLDYAVFQEPLLKLFEATANLLEREWPKNYAHIDSARIIFFQSVRIAINTYNTIFLIVAEDEYHGRRKVYSLSLPALVRTLFEQLIAIIFLIQDIPRYIPWFFKTGYTEQVRELTHVEKYHGDNPRWTQFIATLKARIATQAAHHSLTPEEIANPGKKIGQWPTPGRMQSKLVKDKTASPETLMFLEYINDWLYRELSGQTHLNVAGIVMRGVHFSPDQAKTFFGDQWREKAASWLEDYRQKQVHLSVILMLAIVSEIEGHFHFGRNKRARELWTIVTAFDDMALDFWDIRYSKILPE